MMRSKKSSFNSIKYTPLPSADDNKDQASTSHVALTILDDKLDNKQDILPEKKEHVLPLAKTKLPEYKPEYPAFVMLKIMYPDSHYKSPNISDLIMSFLSPKDFQRWRDTTLNPNRQYDEINEMKHNAEKALIPSWINIIKEFCRIHQSVHIANEAAFYSNDLTVSSLVNCYESLVSACDVNILRSLFSNMINSTEHENTQSKSNALFLSLHRNGYKAVEEVLISGSITNSLFYLIPYKTRQLTQEQRNSLDSYHVSDSTKAKGLYYLSVAENMFEEAPVIPLSFNSQKYYVIGSRDQQYPQKQGVFHLSYNDSHSVNKSGYELRSLDLDGRKHRESLLKDAGEHLTEELVRNMNFYIPPANLYPDHEDMLEYMLGPQPDSNNNGCHYWANHLHILTCYTSWLISCCLFCTDTGCYRPTGHVCCDSNSADSTLVYSFIRPISMTPLLLTCLYAGEESMAVMASAFPNQIKDTVNALNTMMTYDVFSFSRFDKKIANNDNTYYRHYYKKEKAKNALAVFMKIDQVKLVMSIDSATERQKIMGSLLNDIEKTTTEKECTDLYKHYINNPILNIKPTVRCNLFCWSNSTYSREKILFITAIQNKLTILATTKLNQFSPKDCLDYYKKVLMHPALAETHTQHGINNTLTSRKLLMNKIQELEKYLGLDDLITMAR